jgi:hypothetical protein
MIQRNKFGVRVVGRILLVGFFLVAATSRSEILPQVSLPKFPATVLCLTNFGAIGDGKFFNTAAFEQALAALSE